MSAVATELLIVLLLILLNGVFSLAEMALVSSRKTRLEQRANEGDSRARAALELARAPDRFLSTIQVGITLVGILAGAFGGATLSRVIAERLRAIPALASSADAIGLGVVVLAITYLTLIFGELVPKRLALNSPERLAAVMAVPMRTLSVLAGPVVHLLGASTALVLRLLGTSPATEAPVSEEEITILEQGRQAGVFEAAEQDIVESVFRLGDRRVSSLMTPRPEIVWLDAEEAADEAVETILSSHYSRFPVCQGDLDHVFGVVAAKDVLGQYATSQPLDLVALAQRPLFVPETLHAFRLLERFKQHGVQLALVIDEYGGLQGLVTATDLLEALVGDLPTAGESAEADAVQREDGSWLVDGTLPIQELKLLLQVDELPGERSGDYYSVGGLMMHQLARIPRAGDHFTWTGWRFEVIDMDGNRVDKVLASPVPSAEAT